MKTCPNCKKEYADSVAVCPVDGTFLDLEAPAAETETVPLQADEVPHTAETVDRIGTAAAETFDRDARGFGSGVGTVSDRAAATAFSEIGDLTDGEYSENPMFNWLVPLVIVTLLIIVGFMFCSKSGAPTAKANEIKTGVCNKLI
ncbi:MAG TPA: hypothetical protein VF721_12955 [Pyrinomonadaceae bacterium]|jgi:hypothetical protein